MIRYDYSQPYITRDEYLEVKGVDLNIELQDDDNQSNKVNRFIQDITNFVLDHLVMEYNCNELNRQTNQFEDLAEFRRVRFHYGMLEQIEYVLNNGLIQLDSGINRETGAITDFSGLVIGSSALKQFRLGGFCNKQEGTGHRGDLSPKDMPTVEELVLELGKKVDKVDGKGLSTNDYTTADKLLLKQVAQDLNSKVDQENGKVLSDNNFSDAYKEKLDGIESGAQQNVIEEIKLENQPISVAGKSVNIDVSHKEDKANKSTSISSASTDIQYASARAVHNAVESAKANAEDYADSKVTRANLVQVLGEASQYLNGLMSAQDKERLDVLYALLGDSEDADTVVDTINEVLAIFNQYPEGADLVNALASKVEYDDIINAVDSNETRKPLSAAMGKYLKSLIDALTLVVNAKANSSDVYTKTEIDEMVDGFVFADIDTELDPESENAVQNKVVTNNLTHIEPSWIKTGGVNVKKNISQSDGTPIISFIRNHMWLKNGTVFSTDEKYGSTITIPLNDATSITVLPLYLYGQEQNVGNGSFVDEEGNFIKNIDEGAIWDDNQLTFSVSVPENAYGVQLNVVLTSSTQGNTYYHGSPTSSNNPSSSIYVTLNNVKIVFDWLKLGDNVIKYNNINKNPVYENYKVAQPDGTPIINIIRSHMWLKNGTLYTNNTNFGSTETIPLNGKKKFILFPYYKYQKEGSIDNGAFVDENGNWFASLMANAEWDEEHTLLEVTVPGGAYGFQINATFTNDNKYDSLTSSNNNASRSLFYKMNYTIYVPWLKTETNPWDDIPNGVIDYDSLNVDVQERLVLPYEDSYKYWDSLNKPFNFENNYLVSFGDSITAGVYNEGSGNQVTYTDSYIILFARKFNMTHYNRAVSGSCITSGVNESTPICDKVDEYTFRNSSDEFIIIAGGTNDFNSDAPLGQLGDTQKTTFYGALDHICQSLTTNASNSTVIFITPINVNTNNFPRKASGSTLTLNKYRNAIWEVATKYGFNVVDGSTIGFAKKINTTWGNLMIAPNDGTHPTLAGHALYFRGLCGKLK